jgi:hypothetical protein
MQQPKPADDITSTRLATITVDKAVLTKLRPAAVKRDYSLERLTPRTARPHRRGSADDRDIGRLKASDEFHRKVVSLYISAHDDRFDHSRGDRGRARRRPSRT